MIIFFIDIFDAALLLLRKRARSVFSLTVIVIIQPQEWQKNKWGRIWREEDDGHFCETILIYYSRDSFISFKKNVPKSFATTLHSSFFTPGIKSIIGFSPLIFLDVSIAK